MYSFWRSLPAVRHELARQGANFHDPGPLQQLNCKVYNRPQVIMPGAKMLSDMDCRSLAEQCLARIAQQCGEDLVLMARPFQTPATLAYTYQTPDFVATGDITHALAGNGPILVSRLTGTVEVAASALPVEDYIREFEARNALSAQGRN